MTNSAKDAHARFYSALEANLGGDSSAMADIWSTADDISNMGPFGGILVGRDAVMKEFGDQAAIGMGGRVLVDDLHIVETGDLGYSIGMERGEGITDGKGNAVPVSHRVTNIFRREADGWRIVHHHTDIGH
jgi:ketosteroid isomerase-like protein